MSRSNKTPSYRFHKASGNAVVVIKGRSFYLGPWKSPESEAEYKADHRRVVRPRAVGARARIPSIRRPQVRSEDLRADPGILRPRPGVLRQGRRADDGGRRHQAGPQGRQGTLRRHARQGLRPAGPRDLPRAMIARGWSRKSINRQVGRVRKMFKWAASKQMLPKSVHDELTAVEGLRQGRSAAKERPEGRLREGITSCPRISYLANQVATAEHRRFRPADDAGRDTPHRSGTEPPVSE
jgi:hypothetical protein